MNRLRGKRVLITGASAGIGEACARRFAAQGARLVLWARRLDRLERLGAELEAAHDASVRSARVDVRDRDVVAAEAAALVAEDLVPDVLVNNAGLAAGLAKVHEGDPADWDVMLDTNVRGLLNVTRALLPAMVDRGTGHVVNLCSIAGREVYPGGAVYCATKYAVRALNEGMSIDLAGTRIRVTSIDPGMVETEFSMVRFKGDEARARRTYEGVTPLTADDVADAILYATNAPEHVNVRELVLLPTAQRNVYVVHRDG